MALTDGRGNTGHLASAAVHFEWDGNVGYAEGAIEGRALAVPVAGLLDKPLPSCLPDRPPGFEKYAAGPEMVCPGGGKFSKLRSRWAGQRASSSET